MKKIILILSSVFLLSFNSVFAQYIEGEHYVALDTPIDTATGDKIEVRELFWYYCPHCFNIETPLDSWVRTLPETAEFVRQPAVFSDRWINGAIFYYVLEELGEINRLHGKLFKAIHLHKTFFAEQSDFVNWLELHGVNKNRANMAFKSSLVRTKVSKSKINTEKYHLSGVPAIIINGKYWTDASRAGGESEVFKVADYLIKKESGSPYKNFANNNYAANNYNFSSGKVVFDCEISCAVEYGSESSNLKFLYESKDWDNLVNKVIDIGLAEDESYFYLGKAAEGLGFLNAAKIYYTKSIAATKSDMSCGGWPNTCEGFEFPKDAKKALDNIVSNERYIRQKNNKIQARVEKNTNNFASYKDDIPSLLEEWPKMASDQNKYLFAISIDDYDEAPDVSFADRSGKLFVETMQRLGVPKENSIFLSGSKATGTRILSRLKRILNQITSDDTLYFYYAGHGLPSRVNDNTYILPVDGDMGSYEDSNMSIGNLYQTMLKSEAKHINVFIDACFSGRADQDTMVFKGVAGLLIKPRAKIDKSRMTVFTAGEGNQFANEYEEKGHRLFSYHLIKGLLEGKSSLRKLAAYVQKNVSKDSRKRGPTYTQEPVIYGSLNHDL